MDEPRDERAQDPGQGPGEGAGDRIEDTGGNHESGGDPQITESQAAASSAEGEAQPLSVLPVRNPLHFKVAEYDGPLDLLLDLIKKNEMDIFNIHVAEITRQYLDYLAELKRLDLEVAGEFLVMAATLIYIKSKMILPEDNVEDDEEGGDPRAELVRKLLEYQAFKEAAKELGFLQTEHGKAFTRQITDYYLTDLTAEDAGIDTFSANLFDLLSAFQKVISQKGRENMHEVFEEAVSIEEKMAEMKSALLERKKILFAEMFSAKWTRNELIAAFLALLEIVRSKFARVFQDKQFGDILLELIENSQPFKSVEVS